MHTCPALPQAMCVKAGVLAVRRAITPCARHVRAHQLCFTHISPISMHVRFTLAFGRAIHVASPWPCGGCHRSRAPLASADGAATARGPWRGYATAIDFPTQRTIPSLPPPLPPPPSLPPPPPPRALVPH
eukprot:343660-Chlamydomonas_euryale.AAC.9